MPNLGKPKDKPVTQAPAVVNGLLAPTGQGGVLEQREVVYPKFGVDLRCVGSSSGPLTCEEMKTVLGWEAEPDYSTRVLAEHPGMNPAEAMYGDNFDFIDTHGVKVVCWNNRRNRDFDCELAKEYAQTVLNRQWAGPHNMPGETVNGQPIILGRTGICASIQHRGIGYVFACQIWNGPQQAKYLKKWPEEPIFETLLVYGISEDPRILQTLDTGRERTDDDVFFVSDIFKGLIPSPDSHIARKKRSRMLSKAVDVLWKRTGAGNSLEHHYQTQAESLDFAERHKDHLIGRIGDKRGEGAIKGSVLHLFEENANLGISNLKLSPGTCAALCYLFGCSDSNEDDYRDTGVQGDVARTEAKLDWDNWDKAKAFFVDLVKQKKDVSKVTKQALAMLHNAKTGRQATEAEKVAVLIKAWGYYKAGKKPDLADLELSYKQDEHGEMSLDDFPTCGGIDLGPRVKNGDPTPQEIKQKAAEVAQAALAANQPVPRAKGEVRADGTSPVVGTPGSGTPGQPGKPPPPKPRDAAVMQGTDEPTPAELGLTKKELEAMKKKGGPLTAKQQQAKQTAECAAADAAKEKAKEAATPAKNSNGKKNGKPVARK